MKRSKKELREALMSKITKEVVKQYLREKALMEGEAGAPEEEEEKEEPKAEEPKEPATEKPEKPEPEEVQDEPGLEEELAEITDGYIRKLKNAQAAVDQSDVIEIVVRMFDSFGYGNQDKLTILQGIKQEALR